MQIFKEIDLKHRNFYQYIGILADVNKAPTTSPGSNHQHSQTPSNLLVTSMKNQAGKVQNILQATYAVVYKIPYRRIQDTLSAIVACSAFRPSARASKGILHTTYADSPDGT